MMTLTWNAANEIAGGADTDEGFTAFGREVVRRMEQLGMAVDVSHLSDRAFWELCEFAEKPFVASHSNARAVCGHRRNLTDDMFKEIVRRGGVVGLNYSVNFLVNGGEGAGIDDLLRHAHHFLELGGSETLALGSDFDGTDIPPEFDRLDKLDFLINAFDRSGIPPATVDAILFHNANRYLSSL
jgi:membrane dipeptidase